MAVAVERKITYAFGISLACECVKLVNTVEKILDLDTPLKQLRIVCKIDHFNLIFHVNIFINSNQLLTHHLSASYGVGL